MRILYHDADGNLCIVIAAPKAALERVLGELTPEAYRAHVLERSIPPGATDVHEVADDWQPPASRAFRDAWRHKGGAVHIDMPKARHVHRQRIRQARAPRLAALDVAYQRADEDGDAQAKRNIAAQKKALRDATAHPDIEAAQTPEALAAVWPADLAKR